MSLWRCDMALRECKWRSLPDGSVICDRCGKPSERSLRRRCRLPGEVDPVQDPGIVGKAWNYATAIAKWTAAGSPLRAPEEIERIFAICEACPHFSLNVIRQQGLPDDLTFGGKKRPHCMLCGCSLSKAPDGLKNKIAMATESCPDKPPRWTAESNSNNKFP